MKLRDVIATLEAVVVSSSYDPDLEVRTSCGADLMSDVLAFAHSEGTLLLTGLTNPQVVITSEISSVLVIAFVRNKIPPPETIVLAEEKGIPLLRTACSLFEACGRLYSLGLESCDVRGAARKSVQRMLAGLSG